MTDYPSLKRFSNKLRRLEKSKSTSEKVKERIKKIYAELYSREINASRDARDRWNCANGEYYYCKHIGLNSKQCDIFDMPGKCFKKSWIKNRLFILPGNGGEAGEILAMMIRKALQYIIAHKIANK
jgi:hypothetical protein